MANKRHKPEEIVQKLGQVDVLVDQGMQRLDAIREVRIAEQTYYRQREQRSTLHRANHRHRQGALSAKRSTPRPECRKLSIRKHLTARPSGALARRLRPLAVRALRGPGRGPVPDRANPPPRGRRRRRNLRRGPRLRRHQYQAERAQAAAGATQRHRTLPRQ